MIPFHVFLEDSLKHIRILKFLPGENITKTEMVNIFIKLLSTF